MSFRAAVWGGAALVAVAIGCNQAPDGSLGVKAEAIKAADCGGGCGGSVPESAAGKAVRVPIDGSPRLGSDEALVTLVAFSDYQCPFCRRAEETVQQLAGEYGGKLRIVAKHQPLPMHAHALAAAKAAAAAELQGRFWEMHRALFNAGDLADLDAVARAAGLDVGHFRAAMQDKRVEDRVRRDQALAITAGAAGTPTFFVNGRKLIGAQPIERFRAAIDEESARAAAVVKTGVPAARVYDQLMESAAAAAESAPALRSGAAAPPSERVKLDLAGAQARGAPDAPVTIVVFSDFQCPFCARGAGVIKALEQKYPGKVRVAFKHQPLAFHKDARLAAAASLAAAEQGKFWEFHDAVFAHQSELDRAGLEKRAAELGLDAGRFRGALDGDGFAARLAADQAEANRLGVTGTPTFFVNGRRIVGAQPVEAFAAVIEEELGAR